MSIKLSETQLAMMQAASSRDDRCVALSPRIKGGSAQKVVAKLIGAGLAKEVKARNGMPAWRRDSRSGFRSETDGGRNEARRQRRCWREG